MFTTALALLFLVKLFPKTSLYAPATEFILIGMLVLSFYFFEEEKV